MKDHTPIKRHQALVEFSRDHHFGLLLVWKIKQGLAKAVAPERISRYVIYFFNNDLQQHFSEEESHLFPLLPAEDILRRQAENEHVHLYELIDAIRNDQTDKELLLEFAEALKLHIRFEERQLFPSIEAALPNEHSALTSSGAAACSKDIDANWADLFWVTEKAGSSTN